MASLIAAADENERAARGIYRTLFFSWWAYPRTSSPRLLSSLSTVVVVLQEEGGVGGEWDEDGHGRGRHGRLRAGRVRRASPRRPASP